MTDSSSSHLSPMICRWIHQYCSSVGLSPVLDSLNEILRRQLSADEYGQLIDESEVRLKLFHLPHLLRDSPLLIDNLEVGLSHLTDLTTLAALDSSADSSYFTLQLLLRIHALGNLLRSNQPRDTFVEHLDYWFDIDSEERQIHSQDSTDEKMKKTLFKLSRQKLLQYESALARVRQDIEQKEAEMDVKAAEIVSEFEDRYSRTSLDSILREHLRLVESRLRLPKTILEMVQHDFVQGNYAPTPVMPPPIVVPAHQRLAEATESLRSRLRSAEVEADPLAEALETANQAKPASSTPARGRVNRRRRLDEEQSDAEEVEPPTFDDQDMVSQEIASGEDTEEDIEQFPSQKLKLPPVRRGRVASAVKRMRADSDSPPAARSRGAAGKSSGAGGRIPFSAHEVHYLLQGLKEFRTARSKWALILTKYAEHFEPSRKATDLKDKWRNLEKKTRKDIDQAEEGEQGEE